MSLRYLFTICFLVLFFSGYAQDNIRFNNYKNQLDLLKVEVSGLSEKSEVSIPQTSLGNFLLAISKAHEVNINVSPELNSISIINNFTKVPVDELLLFLIKEYDLSLEFTGTIISIKKYQKPIQEEDAIVSLYDPTNKLLTLDLNNDKLDRVFRAIMDATGKNLLFSPEIENSTVTLYIKDVPVEVALEKLAATNNLILSTSRDGFYYFDGVFNNVKSDPSSGTTSRPKIRRRGNFYYKVLDTVGKRLDVDFQNTSIADVVYTLSEDLKINVFTAAPLDNAGFATVKAKGIGFDLLLDKIFQSAVQLETENGDSRNNNTAPKESFTYKREGNLYFFGTDDQLSLKQVEIVRFKNRAIIDFKDPIRSTQNNRNANFVTGSSNLYNQNNSNNPSNNRRTTGSASGSNSPIESIEKIIPIEVKSGLEITTDYELNGFIVNGPGVKVEKFKEFIKSIDVSVPLIYIEVMILEVDRTAILETGISFGIGDKPSKTRGEVFPSTNLRIGSNTINKALAGTGGLGSLNIGKVLPEFYLDIQANETNGNLKILSTPQLSALNGHSAYLSSSQTSYYAITNQTIIGSQNPQTSVIRNYAPVSAELALDIRPIVTENGRITMNVRVIQSNFSGERIEEDAPPDINTREFSSILRMENEELVILGGIEQIIKDDSGSGVPLLARIPILKYLFSKRRRESSKKSLTILIKPTVIN